MKTIGVLASTIFCLFLFTAGCATAPPPDTTDYGPYPQDYESIIKEAIKARPEPVADVTRTVTSITQPVKQKGEDMAGWAAWATIRRTRTNEQGGVNLHERNYYFLLRDGKVVRSDYVKVP